jgi:hypothetical protein
MSKRSKLKRDARQAKCKMRDRPYESNVSNVGGLFAIGEAYARGDSKQELHPEAVTDIKLNSWIAYTNMVTGTESNGDDWANVAGTLNTALMLAEDGYGIEHQEQFNRALEGICRAWLRSQKALQDTGKEIWRFDGPAINDIRDALELHDQQCAIATKGDIRRALAEVKNRINAGQVYQANRVAA